METTQTSIYPKLPKELAGAKPAYRDASLIFSNDVDKAAYIVHSSKKSKKSSRHKEYLQWAVENTGLLPEQIDWIGGEIKRYIPPVYKKNTANGEYEIILPNFYGQYKNDFEEQNNINDEIENEISPEMEKLIKKVQTPEQKETKNKKGLTKGQESLLRNILADLIDIKNSLIQIKKNQEDRIKLEKRREKLNAERLAFSQIEKQLEAVPTEQQGLDQTNLEQKATEEKDKEEADKNPEETWWDKIKRSIVDMGKVSAITGGINLLMGLGGDSSNTTNNSNIQVGGDNTNVQQNLNLNRITPETKAPDIPPVKFAEGGVITPIGKSNSIAPLESSMNNSRGGETTYSREFKLDDLKSPLADVMKLPLKVAGAALLSALSSMAKQVGGTDPKINSDISLTLNQVAKSFGLQSPSINLNSNTTIGGSDAEYVAYINSVSNELVSSGEPLSTPTPAPTSTTNPEPTQPTNTQTSPNTNNQNTGTTPQTPSGQSGNQNGQGGPKDYGKNSNIEMKPFPLANNAKPMDNIPKEKDNKKETLNASVSNKQFGINLLNYSKDTFTSDNSVSRYIANLNVENKLENITPNNLTNTSTVYNQQILKQNDQNLKPVINQIVLPPKVINKNTEQKMPEMVVKTAKLPKTGVNYFIRKQVLGTLM